MSTPRFDATQRHLLASASPPDSPGRDQRLSEALADGVEWSQLVRLARSHRVAALVERALAGQEPDAAGQSARRVLAETVRADLYTSLLLAGELPATLDLLASAGIQALAFKGPTLALVAYGSLALRPFEDLDIAVREADFARAKAELVAAGIAPAAGDEFERVRHLSHEQTFVGRAGRLQIDLHGRLFSREIFPLPLDPLLRRAVPTTVAGREVATLRPEDLLVVLCEHAHKHLWRRAVWIADIAHLVAACPALEWGEARDLAAAAGSRRVLGIGLVLAAELLAAPVPEEILAQLRGDPALVELAAEIRSRLFERLPDEVADFELSSLQWRSRERWADRLRYALTPNESDWMIWPLPARWRGVHYLLRPFRLLAKYGVAPRRRRR